MTRLEDVARRAAGVELDAEETRRYGRHLTLPEVGLEGQKKLKASRVLLVGAGGLGSPLALYLAAAGVGTLGLVDFDRVEASNLQRQVLFGESDYRRLKVEAARERLWEVQPTLEVEIHAERFSAANGRELVARYDVVADGSDNFPTRYLVNDACVLAGRPLAWGAVQRFEGQLAVFWSEHGPCYRCLFPEPPPPGLVPSCAEAGVLGVVPGVVGTLMANEILKLLLGIGEPAIGRFIVYDALRLRFRELRLAKDPDCPVCGDTPRLTELIEYSDACEEERVAEPEEEVPFDIDVQQLQAWREEGREHVLIDVREPHEHEICHIDGARLIPLRELQQRWQEIDSDDLVVVHCHHGPRSAHAVQFLRQQGVSRATNLAGGIDAWSLYVDPSVPRY